MQKDDNILQMENKDLVPSFTKIENPINKGNNTIDYEEVKDEFFNLFKEYDPESKLSKEELKQSFFGQGYRKKSRSFCRLIKNGSGKVRVNRREFTEYFNTLG